MAISRKEEARALSADEHALVEKSHHPAVQGLADADLAGLVKLLRERRDKARPRRIAAAARYAARVRQKEPSPRRPTVARS